LFPKKKPAFREDDLDSLIEACLSHDPEAQKALIRLFYVFAQSICLRYAGSKQETEEMMNDGFLKIFNNLGKYDHSRPFKAWIRTILVNTAIDHYHKKQKYVHEVDIDECDITDWNEDVISRISANEILKMVQQLPPSYRIVFTLYVVEGYNHREIAQMLNIKEGTSKSNLQDARKKLQAMIKKNYPNLHLAYALKVNKVNEN
jgi:RNA polymerase sigma-70 factor (ECF subfamily)